MKTWRRIGVLWACLALSPAAGIAQTVGDASRAAALVGLARTARDQGRAEEAASHFRDADRLQPLNGPLDVIAHSRGGLVTRWALEGFGIGGAGPFRAVMVGAPIGGTSLASPPQLRSPRRLPLRSRC